MACEYKINGLTLSKDEFLNYVKKQPLEDSSKILGIMVTPSAPFITDTNKYVQLGLKVALKYAVKSGATKITWESGETQNDRYDLSKQVEYIQYEDGFGGTKYVDISTQNSIITLQVDKDGKVLENKNTQLPDVVGKNLSDVIGKDATEKIMRGDGNKEKIDALILKGDDGKFGAVVNGKTVSDGFNTYNEAFNDYQNNPKYQNLSKIKRLEGDGLKVGGKGMKGFYGSPTEGSLGIVGNVAKSLFKQEPKTTNLPISTKYNKVENTVPYFLDWAKSKGIKPDIALESWDNQSQIYNDFQKFLQTDLGKLSTQHSIDITPEMVAEVGKGLPLFQAGQIRELQENTNLTEKLSRINLGITQGGFVNKDTDEIYPYGDSISNTKLSESPSEIYLAWLSKNKKEHYDAGVSLISKHKKEVAPYIKEVKQSNPDLKEGSKEWNDKVLSAVIKDTGNILVEGNKKNILQEWLEQLWKYIGKAIGLTNYSPSKIANMTLAEFGQRANVDIVKNIIDEHLSSAADLVTEFIENKDAINKGDISIPTKEAVKELSFDEKFKLVKKEFGETNAKSIRTNMPFVFDTNIDVFIKYLSTKVPIKSHINYVLEVYSSPLLADYLKSLDSNDTDVVAGLTKSPFDIVKDTGYNLIDANTVEGVMSFKKDFRGESVLCTYNNVEGRLSSNFIFWLRKNDADDTLPANELTQNNLSESWKNYLTEKGKVNEDGTFILDLEPKRDDPYGTSSMSVQISKRHGNLSIKNRYNHVVDNPDATLGNNLNKIAEGLQESLYKETGVEMSKQEEDLPDNIFSDSNGRILVYGNEIEGDYYGDGFYTENGEPKFLDVNSERIIDGVVLNSKGISALPFYNVDLPFSGVKVKNVIFKKGNITVINMIYEEEEYPVEIETQNGCIKTIYSEITAPIGFRSFSYNKFLTTINLPKVEVVGGSSIRDAENLRTVNMPSLEVILNNCLRNNTNLTTLNIPSLKEIGSHSLLHLHHLESLNLPNLTDLSQRCISENASLTSLNIPNVIDVSSYTLSGNTSLTALNLPKVKNIEHYSITNNTSLESINVPSLETLGSESFSNLYRLSKLDFPNLLRMKGFNIRNNSSLLSVSAPKLTKIEDNNLYLNPKLENIEMPNLIEAGNGTIRECHSLVYLSLPKLQEVSYRSISENLGLTTLHLPSVTMLRDRAITENSSLLYLDFPSLRIVEENCLKWNNSLIYINAPELMKVGKSSISRNNYLTTINTPKLEYISENSFSRNDSLTDLNFPRLMYMETDSITDNGNLTTVNMPILENMSSYSLSNNDKLTNIIVPNLKQIGNRSIIFNNSLSSINLPYLEIEGDESLKNNGVDFTVTEIKFDEKEYEKFTEILQNKIESNIKNTLSQGGLVTNEDLENLPDCI